jgi:hypothetical protein
MNSPKNSAKLIHPDDVLKALIQQGIDSGIDTSFNPEAHLASLKAQKNTRNQDSATQREI